MRLNGECRSVAYFFLFSSFPCCQRDSRRFHFAIENAIEILFFNRIIAFYFCSVKSFKIKKYGTISNDSRDGRLF